MNDRVTVPYIDHAGIVNSTWVIYFYTVDLNQERWMENQRRECFIHDHENRIC